MKTSALAQFISAKGKNCTCFTSIYNDVLFFYVTFTFVESESGMENHATQTNKQINKQAIQLSVFADLPN